MENERLNITEEKKTGSIKLIINGRINSDSVDGLQDKLQNALDNGRTNIILNMQWVEYLGSAGIRVIIKTYQATKIAGGKLKIEKPSQIVRNILNMAALDEILIA